jgi:predicted amidohydrolase YtcJ
MEMLGFYEAAAREAPIGDLRWVIAHPVTINAEQVAKLEDLGIVITTHTNAYLWKKASGIAAMLGPGKEETLCPIGSLLEAGVPVSLATDNVPISLWPCIWQAIERVDRDTGKVIAPDQRISREEALRCATVHGAYLCLDEDERGTLEPGKLADLVVLDEDPLAIEAERIRHIEPALTVAGGRVVWERGSGIVQEP